MNYEPNIINWKVGDLVLHDADKKADYMIMKVIKIQKNGFYITQYISEYMHKKYPYDAKKKWKNEVKYLHDPQKCGINVEEYESEQQSGGE